MSQHEAPLQERESVASRAIVLAALGAVVICSAAVGVSTWLLGRDGGNVPGTPPALAVGSPRAPRVIGVVEQTLVNRQEVGLEQRALARESLETYGWVDRAHGVARIPIERAMDLYVAQKKDAGAK